MCHAIASPDAASGGRGSPEGPWDGPSGEILRTADVDAAEQFTREKFEGRVSFARRPVGPMGLWVRPAVRGARYVQVVGGDVHAAVDAAETYGCAIRRIRREAALLVQTKNVVEMREQGPVLRVYPCRCCRHVCFACGMLVGREVRRTMTERLRELQTKHGTYGDVQMWTLTIDPNRVEVGGNGIRGDADGRGTPRLAYDHVRVERCIGEWARKLGLRYYVVVVEWHKSGWPHWHILVWEPVRKMRIDHAAARSAWGLGGVNYRDRWHSAQGRVLSSPKPIEWAVRYVTKYLTKPKERPPEWVMELSGTKLVYASAAWGALRNKAHDPCDDQSSDTLDADEAGDPCERAPARPNRDALAECRGGVRVLAERVDTTTGEVCLTFVAEFKLDWRSVRKLAKRVGAQVAVGSCVLPWRGPATVRMFDALRRFSRTARLASSG